MKTRNFLGGNVSPEELYLSSISVAMYGIMAGPVAKDATGALSIAWSRARRIKGIKAISVILSADPAFRERYTFRSFDYGSAEEWAEGLIKVLAINGKEFDIPPVWPPKGWNVKDTYQEKVEFHVYQDEVPPETQDEIIEMAAMNASIAEAITESFENPLSQISQSEFKAIFKDAYARDAGKTYHKILEDYYFKWWDRFGEDDGEGFGKSAEFTYIGDFFLFDRAGKG